AQLLAYDQYDEPDIGQARVVQLGDRSLSIISSPVPASEGVDLGIVHVVRDVTDLQRIDKMKSEFIALVSHELRTPLTSIRGFTELILDGDAGEISDEIASYLMTVRSNTDRLVTLVNDLLDISRIEAGRVTLELGRLDLGALLREAANLIQPQLTASHQRLELELPAFLPRLYADHDRLVQVMVNLLSNAHKYSGEEKPIRLSAEWREGAVRIAVADEGIGISSENQRRLFTNFFRADDIEVRKVHGTGLGLAISRALVEMHGGHIEVSSRVGVGSTFTVVLPVVFQASGQGGDQPGGTAQRILVVDEDPAAATLVRRALEQAGYAVFVATSDHAAIDAVRANPIDLVVLDLLMPRLSGFEAIDRLREHPASSSTPIVVLSIQSDPVQGVRLAPAAVLAKPANEQQLLDAALQAIGEPAGQRVLIVCGEASTRALATIALRRAGYEPLAVGDESRGVQLAHDWAPDGIIGDLSMPGAQGIELVERLKSDSATCELPLIVFSPGDPRALHDVYALSSAEPRAASEPLEGLVKAIRHVLEQLATVGAS
ncbi:MAG: response regulator, partial [Chloroflexi bacterium]|nr:response regulator [Chloroflexota bacterium]